QHFTVPSASSAHEWNSPRASDTAGLAAVMPVTRVGDELVSPGEPSPISPAASLPQHFTVPSARNAHEWKPPDAIALAPVIPDTATGTVLSAVDALPSCPLPFRPQQNIGPPWTSTQVWLPPAESCSAAPIPETVTGTVLVVVVPLPSSPW